MSGFDATPGDFGSGDSPLDEFARRVESSLSPEDAAAILGAIAPAPGDPARDEEAGAIRAWIEEELRERLALEPESRRGDVFAETAESVLRLTRSDAPERAETTPVEVRADAAPPPGEDSAIDFDDMFGEAKPIPDDDELILLARSFGARLAPVDADPERADSFVAAQWGPASEPDPEPEWTPQPGNGEEGREVAAVAEAVEPEVPAGIEPLSAGFDSVPAESAPIAETPERDFGDLVPLAEPGDEIPEPAAASIEPPLPSPPLAPPTADPTLAEAAPSPVPARAPLDELQEVFLAEARERVESMTRDALLAEETGDRGTADSLMRAAHSLKGSAALVGRNDLADMAHALEDLLEAWRGRGGRGDPESIARIVDLCLRFADEATLRLDAFERGEARDAESAVRLADEIRAFAFAAEPAASAPAPLAPGAAAGANGEQDAVVAAAPATRPEADAPAATAPRYVRVELARFDSLLDLASDMLVHRTAVVGRLEELRAELAELSEWRSRLRRAAEGIEESFARAGAGGAVVVGNLGATGTGDRPRSGDYLSDFAESEFDRFAEYDAHARDLSEALAGLAELDDRLGELAAETDRRIGHFSRLGRDLHDAVLAARMVPIGTVFDRFPRLARDLGARLGKRVRLERRGDETLLDKLVAERLGDPLVHLVRNALDHGIETPEGRAAAGKPPVATIRLSARHVGDRAVVEISDDGRGIDPNRVRARAVERGWMSPERAAAASEDELHALLSRPGFSTAEAVDDVSGRGVGLDVVRETVAKLNGTFRIASRPGEGTVFSLGLPVTLAVAEALVVRAGDERFALPLAAVDEIARLAEGETERLAAARIALLRGEATPLVSLREELRLAPPKDPSGAYVVVLGDATGRTGVVVDGIVGREEIVVKPLPAMIARVGPLSGGTIRPDGSAMLVLDAAALLDRASGARAPASGYDGGLPTVAEFDSGSAGERIVPATPRGAARRPAPPPSPDRPRVLVADDSLSIRRYTADLLRRAGYEVETASDGLDAIEKFERAPCSMVLTDLEMPRMHGFELVAELRATEAGSAIPIFVLTSRMGEKHRRKALELGADEFFEKPFDESALLAAVARRLPLAGGGESALA